MLTATQQIQLIIHNKLLLPKIFDHAGNKNLAFLFSIKILLKQIFYQTAISGKKRHKHQTQNSAKLH